MKSLDQLEQKHPAYDEYVRLAEYLYASYIGGDRYRQGAYLTKYFGEDQSGQFNLYAKRLAATPLNNYVKSTVDIYRSFLFRELPTRNMGTLINDPQVQQWVRDTDQEGQGINSFMKSVNDLAMVQGNAWILVDKPAYAVETMAQEIALGIRPYACVYTPANVLDWSYTRNVAGKMELTYIKVIESNTRNETQVACWHPEYIERYRISKDAEGLAEKIVEYDVYENPLKYVPFVNHRPIPAPLPGTGYSLIEDVADIQKYCYNMLSELEQSVRISGHPTLVKTADTNATAGAGSIVTIPQDLEPGLVPFLLQPTGATIGSILDTIDKQLDVIGVITHTDAVQTTHGSPVSGVALQTSRQLLNSKLSDLADTIEETETKMWKIFADWTGITLPEDFNIDYIDTFDIRDQHSELELYTKALAAVPSSEFRQYVEKDIIDMVVDDPAEADRIKQTIGLVDITPDDQS